MADTIGPDRVSGQKGTATPSPPSKKAKRRPRRLWRVLAPIVLLAVLAGGYGLWKYFGTYESTDDARIDGNIVPFSAGINFHIIEVLVEDAQVVRAGDILVKIDPRDYEVAVAQAKGNLAAAEASLESSRINVPVVSTNTAGTLETAHSSLAEADAALVNARKQLEAAQARLESARSQVTEAEANYKRAAGDAERYRQLVVKDEIAHQTHDQAAQTAAADKAAVDARTASVDEARQNVGAGGGVRAPDPNQNPARQRPDSVGHDPAPADCRDRGERESGRRPGGATTRGAQTG